MFDKIIFFELRHYGDLHITRNFVKYIIENIPAKKYVYVLTVNPCSLVDIPKLSFETYNQEVHPFNVYDGWKLVDNVLYINTSCGTANMYFYEGTTIQTAFRIFTYYLKRLCGHTLPSSIHQYIPDVDFDMYDVSAVDAYMNEHQDEQKILIVNGETQSGQVPNFDMYPLIEMLAASFPSCLFFISNKITNISYVYGNCSHALYKPPKNIIYCGDVLETEENNIIETSYFSLFCGLVVGRSSGVYTLSVNKKNVLDVPKKFICISHTEKDKDLGISTIVPSMQQNFIWSNNFNYNAMFDLVKIYIGENHAKL